MLLPLYFHTMFPYPNSPLYLSLSLSFSYISICFSLVLSGFYFLVSLFIFPSFFLLLFPPLSLSPFHFISVPLSPSLTLYLSHLLVSVCLCLSVCLSLSLSLSIYLSIYLILSLCPLSLSVFLTFFLVQLPDLPPPLSLPPLSHPLTSAVSTNTVNCYQTREEMEVAV